MRNLEKDATEELQQGFSIGQGEKGETRMSEPIPLGNCMVIDRKTGKVLQWERTTPERMKAAARVIAKTLVDELMKERRAQS